MDTEQFEMLWDDSMNVIFSFLILKFSFFLTMCNVLGRYQTLNFGTRGLQINGGYGAPTPAPEPTAAPLAPLQLEQQQQVQKQ